MNQRRATVLAVVFGLLALAGFAVSFSLGLALQSATQKLDKISAEIGRLTSNLEQERKISKDATAEVDRLRLKLKDERAASVDQIYRANEDARQAKEKAQEALSQNKKKIVEVLDAATELKLLCDQKLHKIYPNLHKYWPGENSLREGYIESFQISMGRMLVKLRNNTRNNVQPKFEIDFLTDFGFVTGQAKVNWVFDSIEPGGIRTDDVDASMNFGPPTYYVIRY